MKLNLSKDKKKKIVIIFVAFILSITFLVYTTVKGEVIDNIQNKYTDYDILVEIKGEVLKPAIYAMPKDSRIIDLINVSGGLTDNCNTKDINLYEILKDANVYVIPLLIQKGDTININKASISDLMGLINVDMKVANDIINYRQTFGEFTKIDDIKKVSSVTQKIYDGIKEFITI